MAELRLMVDGIAMGESPRWHDGQIWYADWLAGTIVAVAEDKRAEVVVRHESLPLCFDFLSDGSLVLVSSSQGAVLRRRFDGDLEHYADLRAFSPHPWNEIVVDGRGNAYVNGIGFDFPGGEFAPGQIALVTPDGSARLVADGLAFPNGMAVTADNATLLVAESYGECLTAFDIADDGGLSGRRVWASLPGEHPDGICLDADGAAWFADVAGRHCVRVAEGGAVLAQVPLDRGGFACMLGGVAGPTLYITANSWGTDQSVGQGQLLAVGVPTGRAGYPG
jgi:sugar lactone lactonase YvrE